MNKYIKMFMGDNGLKVGDEFRKKGTGAYDIWHFNENGRIENKKGIGSNKVLTKFLLGEYEVEKVKKGPWKPKENEGYWFINSYGDVAWNAYDNDDDDRYILAHSLVFQTKKEAEDYKWFLGKVDEYKRPFESYDYCFYYDYKTEGVQIAFNSSYSYQGTIYFGDKENIDKFLDEVGEKRIKKYMFNVWE